MALPFKRGLSAERQALAAAIVHRDRSKAELDAIMAAVGHGDWDRWESGTGKAVRDAEANLEAATDAIAKARQAAADFTIKKATGEAGDPPAVSVDAAETAKRKAEHDLVAARDAAKTLLARREPAAAMLQWAEHAVETKIKAVLRASPEVQAVLATVERAQKELWKAGDAFVALMRADAYDLGERQANGQLASPAARAELKLNMAPCNWRGLGGVKSSADWNAAIAALKTDAAAELPR